MEFEGPTCGEREAQRVGAVLCDDLDRVHHIADGLAHLAPLPVAHLRMPASALHPSEPSKAPSLVLPKLPELPRKGHTAFAQASQPWRICHWQCSMSPRAC